MKVLDWDAKEAGRYGNPPWNKDRPVIPYSTRDGAVHFESYPGVYWYGTISKRGFAEVQQDFTAALKVLYTTTGRSAANMVLMDPLTDFHYTSTQTDLDWILQNCVLDKGMMDQPVRWRFSKRGANYLLNIVERLESDG